ncbi:MAG: Holliday junction resolvase RuvX [Clostridia bacterium]|nr:Holliday junction resolvase RuvX [Clostridia bacterium]
MRIIGIDYGDARVGIAVSDPLGFTAQGIETVPNKVYAKMLERVVEIIKSYSADKIVIGLPKNMNGTLGPRGEISQKFADELKGYFPETEIILWDERLSTVQAAGILNTTNTRGKDRKNVIDTVAASIILQSYLDSI